MPSIDPNPEPAQDRFDPPLTKASRRLLKLSIATPRPMRVGPLLHLPDAARAPRPAPGRQNRQAAEAPGLPRGPRAGASAP